MYFEVVCSMYLVPYSFILYILHESTLLIIMHTSILHTLSAYSPCILYIAITDRGGSRGNNDVRHVDRGPSDVEDACQGRGQNQNNPPLLLRLALIIAHHEAAA